MTAATILADPHLDTEHLMLDGIDTDPDGDPKNRFTVSDMARTFFNRSNHWIRWIESQGQMFYTDPKTRKKREVGQRRNEKQARYYTLADIEEVAHALAQNGRISGTQLRQTLTLVRVSAEMRGFL